MQSYKRLFYSPRSERPAEAKGRKKEKKTDFFVHFAELLKKAEKSRFRLLFSIDFSMIHLL